MLKVYKVKPGKASVLLAWGARLMSDLHSEALETLNEEHCTRESFFLFKINETYFAVANMEGDSISPAVGREINAQHKAVLRECLEEKIELQEVYDLKTTVPNV